MTASNLTHRFTLEDSDGECVEFEVRPSNGNGLGLHCLGYGSNSCYETDIAYGGKPLLI